MQTLQTQIILQPKISDCAASSTLKIPIMRIPAVFGFLFFQLAESFVREGSSQYKVQNIPFLRICGKAHLLMQEWDGDWKLAVCV